MVKKEWKDALLLAMVNADRGAATTLVDAILEQGTEPQEIISGILDPVLVRLGLLWGEEAVSLAQTFVAAKIAEDILLRCLPTESGQLAKGVVVLGNIEDDFHSLGRRIVASFLRANGWEVHDLGNDVAADVFVEKALEVGASVIGVSAMMQTTALGIRKLRELIDRRDLGRQLKLAVGGAVFVSRPELVTEVGGDGSADNAANADALFWRLQSAARQEHAS